MPCFSGWTLYFCWWFYSWSLNHNQAFISALQIVWLFLQRSEIWLSWLEKTKKNQYLYSCWLSLLCMTVTERRGKVVLGTEQSKSSIDLIKDAYQSLCLVWARVLPLLPITVVMTSCHFGLYGKYQSYLKLSLKVVKWGRSESSSGGELYSATVDRSMHGHVK